MDGLFGPEGSLRRVCAVNTFILLIVWLALIGLVTVGSALLSYLLH